MLLLRAESVASSKIEHVEVSAVQITHHATRDRCGGAIVDELGDLGEHVAFRTASDALWREIQRRVISDQPHRELE